MEEAKRSESEEEHLTELGNTFIVEKVESHSSVQQPRKDGSVSHEEDPEEQR